MKAERRPPRFALAGQGPTTDASGNTTLWLFSSTGYDLTATPPSGDGFLTTTTSADISADTTENITMQQPATLSGHLYDEVNNPLLNQTIFLLSGSTTVATTTTDTSGNYSLTAAPGSYSLVISNTAHKNTDFSQGLPESYSYNVSSYNLAQTTQLDITLPAKKAK